jgi:hypothetical protein
MIDRDRIDEKKQRRAEEAKVVWAEIRKRELDVRERTARLRALRLAKQAPKDRKPLTQIGHK